MEMTYLEWLQSSLTPVCLESSPCVLELVLGDDPPIEDWLAANAADDQFSEDWQSTTILQNDSQCSEFHSQPEDSTVSCEATAGPQNNNINCQKLHGSAKLDSVPVEGAWKEDPVPDCEPPPSDACKREAEERPVIGVGDFTHPPCTEQQKEILPMCIYYNP